MREAKSARNDFGRKKLLVHVCPGHSHHNYIRDPETIRRDKHPVQAMKGRQTSVAHSFLFVQLMKRDRLNKKKYERKYR